MPDLTFEITGVEGATRSLTPLLHFKLRISTADAADAVQGILLNAQVQIQCPARRYSAEEKAKLFELFGAPERWGQTLRNRLWAHTSATTGSFAGTTEVILPVACTYDLNIATAKYLSALKDGMVPLLFLFSGSVFYRSAEGNLQVERISWNKECVFKMPIETWRAMMEEHYPNSGWVSLQRRVLDQLYEYRIERGFTDWDGAVEALLREAGERDRNEKEAAPISREELPA